MGYKVDDVTGLHCIAVNEILGKRRIQGFNSWGKADPLPTMSLERPDLSIFKVAVTKCEMLPGTFGAALALAKVQRVYQGCVLQFEGFCAVKQQVVYRK